MHELRISFSLFQMGLGIDLRYAGLSFHVADASSDSCVVPISAVFTDTFLMSIKQTGELAQLAQLLFFFFLFFTERESVSVFHAANCHQNCLLSYYNSY